MMTFLNEYNLINLIKNNTCFKGEGSCVNLILTNRKYSFKNSRPKRPSSFDLSNIEDNVLIKRFIWKHSVLNSKLKSQENNEHKTFGKNVVDTLNI